MKIFGFEFSLKRAPRYPGYGEFEELSQKIQELSEEIRLARRDTEALRKRFERAKVPEEIPPPAVAPGNNDSIEAMIKSVEGS